MGICELLRSGLASLVAISMQMIGILPLFKKLENNMEKAQLIISRNRIGTDGTGIRTLVSFAGCPLNCRFCINPHLKKEVPEEMRYTPESLLKKISIDRHFFIATRF